MSEIIYIQENGEKRKATSEEIAQFELDAANELENQKYLNLTYKKYHNPSAKFLHKNETGNYMKGAYGYIIKPHAAKKIVDWIYIINVDYCNWWNCYWSD